MSENGVLMYGLAGNWCEECGRAKSYRLWPGVRTGCKTCDEVVTRHRCDRPDLATGQSWECPDCGTLWTATETEDACGECGQGLGTMRRTWESVPGDRIDAAPRYEPQPFAPFRNLFAGTARRPVAPPSSCYVMANGSTVHVKPGCRC